MASNGDNEEKLADTADIEMQETKGLLIDGHGDIKAEVKIVQPNHKEENGKVPKVEFSGLTKEELLKYANDPFWKKVRLILFILFWLVWIGMLAAAVIIIIYAPKCPKRPKLEFWQKKTAYRVDPFAFKDSGNDKIGDIKGLLGKLPYLKNDVGVGFLILDPIFKGQFKTNKSYIGLTTDFMEMDSALGTLDDFKKLIKVARKKDIEIVLSINPNAVSADHIWFSKNKNYFMKIGDTHWKGRNGLSAMQTIGGSLYYTSMGVGPDAKKPLSIDLNLNNSDVVGEMKTVLNYWMELGVRGFLFTDAAFYSESFGPDSTSTQLDGYGEYFKTKNTGQTFQAESVTFLQEMRRTVDEMKTKTDKSRLLMVETGDIGFGLESLDPALSFFGDNSNAAHMIISYEFLKDRGWRVPKSNMDPKIKNYIDSTNSSSWKDIALTTATSTHLRNGYLPAVAATFLLPGTPIVYYGSELNLTYNSSNPADYVANQFKAEFLPYYPNDKRSVIDSSIPNAATMKMSIFNHLPMPWCASGCFVTNTTGVNNVNVSQSFFPLSDVKKVKAIGQPETIFQLYKQLAEIRMNESLLFGDFKWISQPIYNKPVPRGKGTIILQEIFSRFAEGFNKFVVVIMHRQGSKSSLITLTDACPKVTPKLVYPANTNLPIGEQISSDAIHIQASDEPSVHVFECGK